jgi:hypothetical protein
MMRENLGPYSGSERALALLAPRIGKHRAQRLLQEAVGTGRERRLTLVEALRAADLLDPALEQELATPYAGAAGEMVDAVVRRGRAARDHEPERWPS